jgi:hypothetical protein
MALVWHQSFDKIFSNPCKILHIERDRGSMKKVVSILITAFMSVSLHAALIEGDNYTSDDSNFYWTNKDLSLDVLRLDWADTLGEARTEQKSFDDYNSFTSTGEWRWATGAELLSIINWFDTDLNNAGWSEAQNAGTNLFFDLNGFGPRYFGSGINGEIYQEGFDHEGYTYWQFGTLLNNTFEHTWFADFGDQVSALCPAWSVLCNSGYIDLNTPHGFTMDNAIEMLDINVAPLLVRNSGSNTLANNVSEPLSTILFLGALGGLLFYRRA